VILAQYDADSIVVYQAYRHEIGHFAAEHGNFGQHHIINVLENKVEERSI
jgi:Domain of unknown function (DUF4291)